MLARDRKKALQDSSERAMGAVLPCGRGAAHEPEWKRSPPARECTLDLYPEEFRGPCQQREFVEEPLGRRETAAIADLAQLAESLGRFRTGRVLAIEQGRHHEAIGDRQAAPLQRVKRGAFG